MPIVNNTNYPVKQTPVPADHLILLNSENNGAQQTVLISSLPVSTLVQTALSLKQDSASAVTLIGTQTLTNKTLTSPIINTPTGIVKANVGLGNVDNTSDLLKPVSTATNTALDSKLSKAGDTITGDMSNTSTGFFRVSTGTTAQRPTNPLDGMMRFNTSTDRHEFYANAIWRNHARLEGDTFTGTLTAPSIVADSVNTKQLRTTLQTFTPTGTTLTIDLAQGSAVFINLINSTGNITLTLTNAVAGGTYLITVKQGAIARNLIFPAGTRQNSPNEKTYIGLALSRDKIGMDFDGTNFDISVNTNYQ